MNELKELLKKDNILSRFCIWVFGVIIFLMDSLVPKKRSTILFLSYEGKKTSDSPRVIFDYLQQKHETYKYVWAVNAGVSVSDLSKQANVKIINANSPKYFWYLIRAKIWIANCSVERLFPVNYKRHVYVQSWHGIPLKKLGIDEPNLNHLTKSWYKRARFDLLTAESEYDKLAFQKIFPSTTNTLIIGLPRYAKPQSNTKNFEDESLDRHKKTIMFAPTFREYNVAPGGEIEEVQLLTSQNIEALSRKYNVLYRGHYFTAKVNMPSLIDVSSVENLESILAKVDILISDYSSIVFDAAVQGVPVVLYTPDLVKYLNYRGMYVNPMDMGLPIFQNNHDLQNFLLSLDDFKQIKQESTIAFNRYLYQGNRKDTLDKIERFIGGK